MPLDVVILISGFILFMVFIAVLEKKEKRIDKKRHEESDQIVLPVVRAVNEMHKQKYGRPSTELSNEFPEIKEAK